MSYTKAELKQAIQDYCENAETTFVSNLDTFIESCEERIFKSVGLTFFRRNQTANLTTSNQYLNMPSDFLAPFSLSITSGTSKKFLDFKDVNYLQDYAPDSSVTGEPRYYAPFDYQNFIVAPTPDSDYAVELHYFYRPASLTAGAGTGTTWLSENAELAMLYGSLMEAYIFMKGEADMQALYEKRFGESIMGLKMFGESKEVTDQYRTGMVIRPKQ